MVNAYLSISWHFLIQASLGPYAWEAATEMKVAPVVKSHLPVHDEKENNIRRKPGPLRVYSYGKSSHANCQLDDDIRGLPRTAEILLQMDRDPVLAYKLPLPGSTAGKILDHACSTFESLYKKWQPMTFKFGITHCPSFRYHNVHYGYKFSKDPFEELLVVYGAGNPHGPAFLEAALIQKFGGYLVARCVFTY